MSALSTRRWYDSFANFYDASLDRTYREHRVQAVHALQISPGSTVVDVGCGTGASLPYLVAAVGPEGRVIGADASPGMLEKARRRVERNGWDNVELFEVTGADDGDRIAALGPLDRIQFFLSLSVIGPWQHALAMWRSALAPAGRVVIADVHNARPGGYARLVEIIARADLTRASWQPLEDAPNFALQWHPSSWVLGGKFFTAAADKGASANASGVERVTTGGSCSAFASRSRDERAASSRTGRGAAPHRILLAEAAPSLCLSDSCRGLRAGQGNVPTRRR